MVWKRNALCRCMYLNTWSLVGGPIGGSYKTIKEWDLTLLILVTKGELSYRMSAFVYANSSCKMLSEQHRI